MKFSELSNMITKTIETINSVHVLTLQFAITVALRPPRGRGGAAGGGRGRGRPERAPQPAGITSAGAASAPPAHNTTDQFRQLPGVIRETWKTFAEIFQNTLYFDYWVEVLLKAFLGRLAIFYYYDSCVFCHLSSNMNH